MSNKLTEIYPLGSVIQAAGSKALVAGYDFLGEGEKVKLHYLLVPYPRGYMEKNDLRIVAFDECELLESGYRGAMFPPYEKYLQGMCVATEKYTVQEIRQAIEQMKTEVEKA